MKRSFLSWGEGKTGEPGEKPLGKFSASSTKSTTRKTSDGNERDGWKYKETRRVLTETQMPVHHWVLVNPLFPNCDHHLISPYHVTRQSSSSVRGMSKLRSPPRVGDLFYSSPGAPSKTVIFFFIPLVLTPASERRFGKLMLSLLASLS